MLLPDTILKTTHMTPSNASRLSTFLKVIAEKLISICIRNQDREMKQNVEEFLD